MWFVYTPANHKCVNCRPSPSLTPVPQVRVYKCLIVLSSVHLLALSGKALIIHCNLGVFCNYQWLFLRASVLQLCVRYHKTVKLYMLFL